MTRIVSHAMTPPLVYRPTGGVPIVLQGPQPFVTLIRENERSRTERRPKPKVLGRDPTAVYSRRYEVSIDDIEINTPELTGSLMGVQYSQIPIGWEIPTLDESYLQYAQFPPIQSQVLKLRQKLNDTPFDLTQFIAEFGSTKDMYVQAAQGFVDFVSTAWKARKGDRAALGRVWRSFLGPTGPHGKRSPGSVLTHLRDTASSAWLMNSYGISPHLGEVSGYCEELARLSYASEDDPLFQPQKHFRTTCSSEDVVLHPIDDDAYAKGHFGIRPRVKIEVSGRRTLSVVASATPSRTVMQRYFGIRSPLKLLQVGWELLPLSCVADYFIGVGDWLYDLDATAGWDVSPMVVSTSYTAKQTGLLVNASLKVSYRNLDSIENTADTPLLGLPSANQWKNVLALGPTLRAIASGEISKLSRLT